MICSDDELMTLNGGDLRGQPVRIRGGDEFELPDSDMMAFERRGRALVSRDTVVAR